MAEEEEYDVDKIVGDVEKAVLAGKCRPATEKESLELRLAALENIVKSCKELVEKIYSDSSGKRKGAVGGRRFWGIT